jgi:hypothetical protein
MIRPYNTSAHGAGDDLLRNFAKAVNRSKHRMAVSLRPIANHNARINLHPGEVNATVAIPIGMMPITHGKIELIRFRGLAPTDVLTLFRLATTFSDGPLLEQLTLSTLDHAIQTAEQFMDRSEAALG